MMALLRDDIGVDLASAKRHFGEAAVLYRSQDAARGYLTVMAFRHAMQSGYTSFETAIKRLLQMLGEPLPVGPDRHAALLKRVSRPVDGPRAAVFTPPMTAHLEGLHRFRHIAMHSDDDFDFGRAVLPVAAAEAFVDGIDAAVARFRAIGDRDG